MSFILNLYFFSQNCRTLSSCQKKILSMDSSTGFSRKDKSCLAALNCISLYANPLSLVKFRIRSSSQLHLYSNLFNCFTLVYRQFYQGLSLLKQQLFWFFLILVSALLFLIFIYAISSSYSTGKFLALSSYLFISSKFIYSLIYSITLAFRSGDKNAFLLLGIGTSSAVS